MEGKEILFSRALEQIRKTAIGQGNCIHEQQVREAFSSFELSDGQMQLVHDYLRKHNIGIGHPGGDEALTEEERTVLRQYLDEIEGFGKISEEEKSAVTCAAISGDSSAQDRMAQVYLQDVAQTARLYAGQGVCIEDLIGEGNVALAKGVRELGALVHFMEGDLSADDETARRAQGILAKMIMDAMEEYIRLSDLNRKADLKAAHKANHVLEKAKGLAEDFGRKVSPEELAAETGLSLDDIWEAIHLSGFHIEYIEVGPNTEIGGICV
jgi:RNA polymerase primary sigma factor